MKFIFPQNYKFNNKILGVFDYSTAIINIVWYVFVYIIINFIFKFINNKFWATLIYFILIIILSYIYHWIVKKINKYLK